MAWESWDGGRVWVAKDGTRTYYGEVNGRMVSTRRHDEHAAVVALLKLNTGARPAPRLPLDDVWIAEYLEDCKARGIHPQSVNQKRRELHDWARLVGLRRPDLILLNELSKAMGGRRAEGACSEPSTAWSLWPSSERPR